MQEMLKQVARDGTGSAWEAGGPVGLPTLPALFASFLRLGCVSFGGPSMVAYIRRMAVVRRRWIDEDDFRLGTALCQAVPGATSMQAAAYVGLRTRGLGGAVAAYVGFGLPAFALMLAMSLAYERAVAVQAVTAALTGLRALVVALVVNAAWTFGRSAIHTVRSAALAATTAALFLAGGSPFLIVVGAGLAGAVLLKSGRGDVDGSGQPPRQWWQVLRSPALVLVLGGGLIGTLWVVDRKLAILGAVMMKVDAFAFGGGFASVPLMYHEVVEVRGWVPPPVFLDGIALGQVTPGPIVITATFVGQRVAGLAGALVATVSIFLPSLFVLLVAEPLFRRLRSRPSFAGATRGLVLSFVGLLGSVAVLFARITPWSMTSGAVAALGLAALLLEVDVVWVVLAGGAISALLM
jgi:chromate transporter